MTLKLDESAYELLMQQGYKPEYGAREMDRTINDLIAKPLADGLLANKFKKGQAIQIKASEDKLVLESEQE